MLIWSTKKAENGHLNENEHTQKPSLTIWRNMVMSGGKKQKNRTRHWCPQGGKKVKLHDQCSHLVFWAIWNVGNCFLAKVKSSFLKNLRFLALFCIKRFSGWFYRIFDSKMSILIKFPFIWQVALYGFHKKQNFHILNHHCNSHNSGLKNNKAGYMPTKVAWSGQGQ